MSLSPIPVDPDIWPMIRAGVHEPHEFIFKPGLYYDLTIPKEWSGSVLRSERPLAARCLGKVDAFRIEKGCTNITLEWFAVSGYARGFNTGKPEDEPKSLKTSAITIRRCWIHNCGMDGFFGTSHSSRLVGCIIENNGSSQLHHGVYMGGVYNEVTDCRIRYNRGLGIACAVGMQRAKIARNLIHNNDGGGLYIPDIFEISNPKDATIVEWNTLVNNCSKLDLNVTRIPGGSGRTDPFVCRHNLWGRAGVPLDIDWSACMQYTDVLVAEAKDYQLDATCGWPKKNWSRTREDWPRIGKNGQDAMAYANDVATEPGIPLSLFPQL